MKKIIAILATTILLLISILLFSCSKEREDESQYLDKDPNCYAATSGRIEAKKLIKQAECESGIDISKL
jgi:uncharacterized protein YxeA